MTVFMFPGQGAQKPGMGADLLGIAEVAQTFAIAGEVCGVDVAALAREGSAEQVNDAYNAQVLARAVSCARCPRDSSGSYARIFPGSDQRSYGKRRFER